MHSPTDSLAVQPLFDDVTRSLTGSQAGHDVVAWFPAQEGMFYELLAGNSPST